MGAGHPYQQLGAKRYLADSANALFRVARRVQSGTEQDPNWCHDPVPPEQCAERLARREHTPASFDHRRLDLPSGGTRRTECPADPAIELFFASLMRDLWALPGPFFPAQIPNVPSPCATVLDWRQIQLHCRLPTPQFAKGVYN